MDDRSSSGAFITGIDAGGTHNNLLDQVRVDNEKLKQIVGQFSNKVEVLIDKQRNEYIQAYEGHMQEVQKELHSLREKVADIANDETKNEKTETLKNNQKKYKEEALKLEADSDELLQKIKKLVRRVYTVEKSRDWMLKRLRQAKQEYNSLLKERNRLYEDWDTRTMSQSLASMSNASSYTLDLKESLKDAALSGLKLNNTNYSTQAHSRVQLEFSVQRNGSTGSLPALPNKPTQNTGNKSIKPWDNYNNTTKSTANLVSPEVAKSYSLPALPPGGAGGGGGSKALAKSISGPALLLATFANNVNNFGGRKSRGTRESGNEAVGEESVGTLSEGGRIPVCEQPVEDVDEKVALARLISLRTRRQEVREFLQTCSRSLHRGPWCRVKARPLDKLLEACQDKLAHSGGKFRSEELLQLVCELAVQPDTYEALAEIFDSYAPLPENYMSDEDIEASAVVRSPHQLGIDPIADQLIRRFGEASVSSTGDAGEAGCVAGEGGSDIAVDFRERLAKITRTADAGSSADKAAASGGGTGIPDYIHTKADKTKAKKAMGGTLDKDLTAYFAQEGDTKRLSNLKFFERDNFMDFD